MGHLMALVAIAQLVIGFLVGTTNVVAAQFFFVLAAFAASAGIAIEVKSRTHAVTRRRL